MTTTFTVVCVYNSEDVLEKYLRPGLQRQTAPYELRLVDNRSRQFSNAADALNFGARDVASDYLVFIHQDVELLGSDFFQRASAHLERLPELGIAGIVGASGSGSHTTLHGRCLQGGGPADGFSPGFDAALPTQTVDELLMIVPRRWFEQLAFDSRACPGWDLYGTEYALSCARQQRHVVVLPLPVRHASWGKLRRPYFETLASVQHKHADVAVLHTTCGTWPTGRSAWQHWFVHKTTAARKLALKRMLHWFGT